MNVAVPDLGLEHLEDGVLNRLCIDEIFVQDKASQTEQGDRVMEGPGEAEQIGSTRASQLSYQSSLFLLRVLFYRKVKPNQSKQCAKLVELICSCEACNISNALL